MRHPVRHLIDGFVRCAVLAIVVSATLMPSTATLASDDNEVRTVLLAPARADDASLRYRLLPQLTDLTDDSNAADIYRELFKAVEDWAPTVAEDRWFNWTEVALDELPKEKARTLLNEAPWLKLVDDAARCKQCDWGFEAGKADLPPWSYVRQAGRVLAIRARLAISERRFDDAHQDIAAGFVMARHIQEKGTLTDVMVSHAIVRMLYSQLETLAAQPDAPNLYWAHRRAPHLLPPLHDAMEHERLILERHWPKLQKKEGVIDLPADQWLRIFGATLWASSMEELLPDAWDDEEHDRDQTRQFALSAVLRVYPIARQHFLDGGLNEQALDEHSPTTVAMTYAFRRYQCYRDRLHGWLSLPYHEFAPHEKRVRDELRNVWFKDGMPFTLMLTGRMYIPETRAESQRNRRVLIIAEALRDHAARHGRLPESLDRVGLPLPNDPMTGKTFRLERHNDGVLLTSEPSEFAEPLRVLFKLAEPKEDSRS